MMILRRILDIWSNLAKLNWRLIKIILTFIPVESLYPPAWSPGSVTAGLQRYCWISLFPRNALGVARMYSVGYMMWRCCLNVKYLLEDSGQCSDDESSTKAWWLGDIYGAGSYAECLASRSSGQLAPRWRQRVACWAPWGVAGTT